MKLKILQIDYHRNGSGNGFSVVHFKNGSIPMLAVVFENNGSPDIAILNTQRLAVPNGSNSEINFATGAEECAWDSKFFQEQILDAITKAEIQYDKLHHIPEMEVDGA